MFKSKKINHNNSGFGNLRIGRPSVVSFLLLNAILITIGILVVWSAFSYVDEVTHAEGRIIPSSRMQIVQNMEGGIVRSINVKQGDVVEKDDVVLQMESVQYSSELDSKKQQVMSLMAKQARLQAEVNDQTLLFTKEFSAMASQYVQTEMSEFDSRRRRLNADVNLLESQLNSGQQELEIVRKMTERGLEPQIELVRTQARVDELRNKIESMKRQFKSESATELSRVVLELNPLRQTLPAYADKLNRTQVKAPLKGVVNRVMVNTVGGVIKPGEPIVEIVPFDDTLVVEAQIRPQDIGFIHLGQSANVKITAYDYSIFGSLKGQITNISPDSVSKEERGQVMYYYVARIETSAKVIQSLEKNLPIIPGMQAQVDIITGNKSVLSYLLKPLIGVKENAFRER
jgi:adhesin transport system membrane fusion protein